MRKLMILPLVAMLGLLATSSAFAANKPTATAVMLAPSTSQYVATFVEDCSLSTTAPYLGVYLGQTYDLTGGAYLAINSHHGTLYASSRAPASQESIVYEVGGTSAIGCVPAGTRIELFSLAGTGGVPILLGTGTVMPI